MKKAEQADIAEEKKIRVLTGGPYLVTGGIPLREKIIVPKGRGYVYQPGRALPQGERVTLCRCGQSSMAPFCDGSHVAASFVGQETAKRIPYEKRADLMESPGVDLLDDYRCALANFCHREAGSVWDLMESEDPLPHREEIILGAVECPSGRLTAVEKDGRVIEPVYDPAITVLQDQERGVGGALFVQGGIQLVGADGVTYEKQNRYTLCRCGKSRNKPFCDASHVSAGFKEDRGKE